jgi:hypothetical protein
VSTHPKPELLVDYLASDLSREDEARLEEHLFDCDACSAIAAELSSVGAGVRTAIAEGKAGIVATDSLLAMLEERGVVLRHYSVEPGGRLECTVGAEDAFVVAHYSADFTGVDRVTVVARTMAGAEIRRLEDIPVGPGTRTVHVLLRGDQLRMRPSGTHLVTVRAGDRIIAEYTFNHTAFTG